MSNLKSKALAVCSWFFGVLFITTALGMIFQEAIITGVLMLVGSVLLLPPIKRIILNKRPKIGKGKITVAGSILIFVSMLFIPTNDQTTADEPVTVETDNVKPESNSGTKVDRLPEYKILEDTVKSNVKRTVEVELSSRIDEEQLRALAEHIYALKDVDVQRTFIGYKIAGEHKSQAYWATTHYNPDLEVKIIGESASDYEKIKNTALPNGDVLGSWMVSWGMEYKSIAYEKDGKTYIRNIHSDGSQGDEFYERSKSDKGIKLQDESGKDHNEYFIINKNGDLEFWSENGNYYTAPKISDAKLVRAQEKNEKIVLQKPKGLSGPQKNAVRSAEQYISMTGFSRDGLINQLSSDGGEGYEVADATIAVDTLNINWNEQAARTAKNYLDMTGFSCNGLIDQLSSDGGEGYTVDQATYGAQQVGAC